MRIIADQNIPFIRGVLEPYSEVEYIRGEAISHSDVCRADALLVRTRTKCGPALLEGSSVKFIGTATIGTDHIDMQWCRTNGIEVVSAAGSNAGGVLQWISAALAGLAAADGWEPQQKTLGVIGVGHIGSLVRRYAMQWGFRVLCSDPPREQAEGLGPRQGFLPFAEVAGESDILTFHTPLTRSGKYPTAGLGGASFFNAMKAGSAVINSSRGGVIDEGLFKEQLKAGYCKGLIDTWAGEPDIDRELLDLSLVATPHIAGYSVPGKANASSMVINALAKHFSFPLSGWFPEGLRPVDRRFITWEQMCATIGSYCDLAAQTSALKSSPCRFEQIRENYAYREEYF